MNWYVAHNGQSLGPYSTQQMQSMAAARQITPGMQVCDATGGQWVAAGMLGWLFPQVPTSVGYAAPTTEVFNPSPMLAKAMIAAVSRPHTTHVHVQRPHGNSLGLTSLILGILAFMFCWIPFVGFLTIPVAAFAMLLGLLGFAVSLLRGGAGVGTSLGGMFLSGLVLVLYAIFFAAIGATVAAIDAASNEVGSGRPAIGSAVITPHNHPWGEDAALFQPRQWKLRSGSRFVGIVRSVDQSGGGSVKFVTSEGESKTVTLNDFAEDSLAFIRENLGSSDGAIDVSTLTPSIEPSPFQPLPESAADKAERLRMQIEASRGSKTAPKIYQLREWTFTNRPPMKGRLRQYGPLKVQIEEENYGLHEFDTADLSKESKAFIAANLY